MKHLIIVLVALVFANISYGQISTSEDTTTYQCLDYGKYTDVHAGLISADNRVTPVDFKVMAVDLPANGWSLLSICDNLNCYNFPVSGFSFTSANLNTGDTMDVKATFDLTATADDGVGIVVLKASKNSDTADIIFKAWTCGPQSIENLDSKSFDINYYSGNLKLILGSQSSAKTYRIYDIYGQTIAQGNITDQIQQIQFERIPSIYIMQMLDKNGEQIETKKFTNY